MYSTGPTYTFRPQTKKYTNPKLTPTPKMRMFQFMSSGGGCGAMGKNANKTAMHKYMIATPLIHMPALPRSNRDGSNGSLCHRLRNTHAMDMVYEESREQTPSDAMELKATGDPMLIIASAMEMVNDTRTELTGMSRPGRTYDRKALPGTPLSRAKAKS
jgi:hypothetical protein